MHLVRIVLSVLLIASLWGCAAVPSFTPVAAIDSPAETRTLPEGYGWWYARFHFDWPEGQEARWYMGTLIGGEVIAPIFDDYSSDVYIWRIHRRSARDSGGHVFSFIFYSTPQGAQRIYDAIDHHPVVQSLLDKGSLIKVAFDDVSSITRPNIEDTSDKHWPVSVQQTWPAMIMGASRMWLDLVSEFAAEESNAGGIETKYKKVQDDVTRIWQEQGQHAILHHINAVYAYQPLLMRY